MRRSLFLLAALLPLAFAPAPLPRRGGDPKRLQGAWVLTSIAQAGKPQRFSNSQWVFSGDNLALSNEDGSYHWTFTINLKSSPKALDMRTPSGERDEELLLKAVYTLDGDTLKVCYNGSRWMDRPTDLSGSTQNHLLLVFERKKH